MKYMSKYEGGFRGWWQEFSVAEFPSTVVNCRGKKKFECALDFFININIILLLLLYGPGIIAFDTHASI